MTSSAVELFAFAVALFWVALTLDRSRSWPGGLRLPDVGSEGAGAGLAPARSTGSQVFAVIPARNEADLLPDTLPSLLSQKELSGVVLVDDASEDRTAAVARELAGGEDSNALLHVVRASPTPPGWVGKVHAMACGVEAVTERFAPEEEAWLLLTDADIHHRAGSVAALLARARDGYDLVSVMARLRAESFWERLLVPTFVFFFQLLYPFRKVSTPGSKVSAAAGGCVLVRAEALDRAAGLGSISGALIDDVALAKSVSAAGGRLWLGLDDGIRSLRPYPRLVDLWRMIARSAFDQLRYRLDLLIAVLLGLALFFVGPPLVLAVGVSAALAGDPTAWRPALWAGLALLLQAFALRPSVKHHGLRVGWATVLPLSSLLFGAMTLSSAWSRLSGRGVRWRGRAVRPASE